jgi:hypothetical protein
VDDLTRWNHNYDENPTYLSDGWSWSNFTEGGKAFDDDQMKAKKAELDAIARPLAEKARPYIDGYLILPPGVMREGDDERFQEVKIWDEAVKRVEPE